MIEVFKCLCCCVLMCVALLCFDVPYVGLPCFGLPFISIVLMIQQTDFELRFGSIERRFKTGFKHKCCLDPTLPHSEALLWLAAGAV